MPSGISMLITLEHEHTALTPSHRQVTLMMTRFISAAAQYTPSPPIGIEVSRHRGRQRGVSWSTAA
jgi:hypothetical protein